MEPTLEDRIRETLMKAREAKGAIPPKGDPRLLAIATTKLEEALLFMRAATNTGLLS